MLNGNWKWPDELSTAITFLDDEHRNLARKYLVLVKDVKDNANVLHFLADFKELMEDIRLHFAHEERVMRNINYPHLHEHKVAHDRLLEDFADFIENIGEGFGERDFPALGEFFKYWFLNHIQQYDIQIRYFIDRSD